MVNLIGVKMIDFLKGLAIFAGVIAAFFIGKLRAENKRLEENLEEKESTIDAIKENEKIKEGNSIMSKSDIINGL
ncbi:MAG: hypothetical protein RI930_51 [Pseudomonadota bacterium]|jgi:hypothetical protein